MKIFTGHTAMVFLALVLGSILFNSGAFLVQREARVQQIIDNSAPVVENMTITDQKVVDGRLYIRVVGDKVRDCRLLNIYGEYGNKQAVVRFLNDKVDEGVFLLPSSRPEGSHDFGTWEIEPDPGGEPLSIFTVHLCNGQPVRTQIGTFIKDEFVK